MTTLPELTAGPLALWRLRGVERHELVCEVRCAGDFLGLTVYDFSTGWELISETHVDLESLVSRSSRMLMTCLAEGWREPCSIEDAWVASSRGDTRA